MKNILIVIVAFAVASCSVKVIKPQSYNATSEISEYNLRLIAVARNRAKYSFPWMVALMHTKNSQPKFFCGATLISKTFVISGDLFE